MIIMYILVSNLKNFIVIKFDTKLDKTYILCEASITSSHEIELLMRKFLYFTIEKYGSFEALIQQLQNRIYCGNWMSINRINLTTDTSNIDQLDKYGLQDLREHLFKEVISVLELEEKQYCMTNKLLEGMI